MTSDRQRDRDEISELLHRYAWMVDERRWELMDEVFAPGATLDYTSTGGEKGPYRETLAWLDRERAQRLLRAHGPRAARRLARGDHDGRLLRGPPGADAARLAHRRARVPAE